MAVGPTPNPTSPAPAPRRSVPRALLATLLAFPVVAGGLWWGLARRSGAPAGAPRAADPRLAYAGPYLNVRPGVGYVGDSACADCHLDKAETYADHPMARSLAPAARRTPWPPCDRSHHNPFDAGGAHFEVVRDGERLRHRASRLDEEGRPVFEADLEVRYVLGSGRRGHSYLAERDGLLFQSPVSWFSRKEVWDLSPGFRPDVFAGRPLRAGCLFCHANRVNLRPDTDNRYEEPAFDGYGIGCERCHGPGELHVKERTRDMAVEAPADYTVVNPGKLPAPLREAVCQQCHLEGEARVLRLGRGLYDFRPGLPLEDFWGIFVSPTGPAGERRAVNHVEQMVGSKCFTASAGTGRPLGCVSCHDPHVAVGPDRRVAHYRQACLSCHRVQSCALPRPARLRESPPDSCVDCHMPRYAASDIAHTAATDHTIPRRPPGGGRPLPAHPTGGPLVDFFRPGASPATAGQRRDLGLALVSRLLSGGGDRRADPRRAAALLEVAVREDAEDVEAWESLGLALMMQERRREALRAFESALALGPRRARSLAGAATVAQEIGEVDRAVDFWRRAIRVNPGDSASYRGLALLLARRREWDELGELCRAWLRRDPLSIPGRMTQVLCLLGKGRRAEAQAEFNRLRRTRPKGLPELERWFAQELGRAGG
jgi:hypothetical protein